MLTVVPEEPDVPTRKRLTIEERRARHAERNKRLRARSSAPAVFVGNLIAVYDITAERVVLAMPGAIRSEPSEEEVMPTE